MPSSVLRDRTRPVGSAIRHRWTNGGPYLVISSATHRLHSFLLGRLHLVRDLLRCLLVWRSHALPFLHAARAAEQKPDDAEHDERHRSPDGSYEMHRSITPFLSLVEGSTA